MQLEQTRNAFLLKEDFLREKIYLSVTIEILLTLSRKMIKTKSYIFSKRRIFQKHEENDICINFHDISNYKNTNVILPEYFKTSILLIYYHL